MSRDFSAILAISLTLLASGGKAQPAERNRHPLARPEFDAGAADPALRLERMILVLRSDPAREAALQTLLAAQQNSSSPLYHQWLTPEEFAQRFGASGDDIERIVRWLETQGFRVEEVPAGGRTILFSGTVGQVENAFQVEMRRYRWNGQMHIANAGDPRIPAVLAGVVAGIESLHDFRRRAMHTPFARKPQWTDGGSYYLAPGDWAAIYDLNALYGSGINGAGESLAIVARCNIPITDAETFRTTFGLPANNPAIVVNGTDPGVTSQDELSEADLDSQWSGAIAPQATVDFVVSASTQTTDGVDLSAQYIVSHNLAPVMSTSFGSCEQYMGSTELTFYNNLWEQAASQGITALVAAGDSGAAGCDDGGESSAGGGLGVNGLCSTPYSVCVGGTEFNEGSNPGEYWSPNNAGNWSSALGYIPEMVWNESGAVSGGSGLWAGGGGASVVYAKPNWQTGAGVPTDGRRDVPDISLTAAGHDCYLMIQEGELGGIAGTSAASPSFAGLMALVNQRTGSRQGNANVSLYALAALQGAGGLGYFHDVTIGNNSVPGQTGYSATADYDRASGLGSVDGAILVNHWTDATNGGTPGFVLSASPASVTIGPGASGGVTVGIKGAAGFDAGVSLSVSGLPAGVTASFSPASVSAPGSGNSTLTFTAASGAGAADTTVTITASGGSVVQTFPVTLIVSTTPGCTLSATVTAFTLNPSSTASTQVSCGSVIGGFKTALKLGISGAPEGVTMSASPTSVTPGTASSKVTIATSSSAPVGAYSFNLTATGGGLSLTLPVTLTINPAPTFTLSMSPTSLSVLQGTPGGVTVTSAHVGTFDSSVAWSISGLPTGVTASFSPATIAAPGDGSSALTIQVGSTATAGTYQVTIKGTAAGISKTLTLPLTTRVLPAFKMSLAEKSLTVGQGISAAVNVTVSGLVGGFDSVVSLSAAPSAGGSLPAGLHAVFTPASLAAPGSGSSLLSFSPDNTAAPGAYSLTITASGGGVVVTAPFTLTVTPPPGFSLKAAASTLNVLAGGSASTQVTATAVYGFSSTVTLSAGSLPAGVVVSFSPAAISGAGGHTTMNVQSTSSATPGTYTINVSASGGNVTAVVAVTLNIGQLTVAPAQGSLTVKHGSSGSVGITTGVAGAYNGTVTLAAAGLPQGVTAAFSPGSLSNPSAGSSTLKLTAASTAQTGGYTITIKATSDGLTASARLMLTVD